jgi:hypothetical protein
MTPIQKVSFDKLKDLKERLYRLTKLVEYPNIKPNTEFEALDRLYKIEYLVEAAEVMLI